MAEKIEWLCMSINKLEHDYICEPEYCDLKDCPLQIALTRIEKMQSLAATLRVEAIGSEDNTDAVVNQVKESIASRIEEAITV